MRLCFPKTFLLACCLLMLTGCIAGAVYQPVNRVKYTPGHAHLAYEDVSIRTGDGIRISAWWIPAENPSATVLFCHGNGGNISNCLDTALIVHGLGLNLLLFDYRGYGTSDGSPSEQGTYLDAEAALEYLVVVRKTPRERIILWGRSLGGPVAARTAAMHPGGPVILESTFTSLRDLVNERFSWVPSWMLADYAYDTGSHLGEIASPILVIHSPDDEIVPFRHGRLLYDSCKGPRSFAKIRGSHNFGFLDSMDVYRTSIMEFLDTCYPDRKETRK